MADKKPKTTISKEYLTGRITARVVSIKSRVAERKAEIDEIMVAKSQPDRNWVRSTGDRLEALSTWIDEETDKWEFDKDPDPDTIVRTANALETKLGELRNRPWLDSDRRGRMSALVAETNALTRELDLIEHALAYMEENPIEEFSITSLRSLGLLDAVKFVLTPEADDKRAGRKH